MESNNFFLEVLKIFSNNWFWLIIGFVIVLPIAKLSVQSLVSIYTIKIQHPTKVMISITEGQSQKVIEISSHSINLKNLKELEGQLVASNSKADMVLVESKKEAS